MVMTVHIVTEYQFRLLVYNFVKIKQLKSYITLPCRVGEDE
jgi:hypothetical protein